MRTDAETFARYAQRYAANLGPDGAPWPFPSIFFAGHIPAGKLAAATAAFAESGADETVQLLVDDSDAGSGRSGLVVTERSLCYSLCYTEARGRRVKGCLPLDDINMLEFMQGESGIDINLNGRQLGIMTRLNPAEVTALRTFFRRLFTSELGRPLAPASYADGPTAGAAAYRQDDPELVEKLRAFEKHHQAFCLQCGYDGLMGIEKRCLPWYLTWWVIIPMLVSSVGIVPGIALWLNRSGALRFHVKCPNCEASLKTL